MNSYPKASRVGKGDVLEGGSVVGDQQGWGFFLEWALGTGPKSPVSQYSMIDAIPEIWTVVGNDTVLVNRIWFDFHD